MNVDQIDSQDVSESVKSAQSKDLEYQKQSTLKLAVSRLSHFVASPKVLVISGIAMSLCLIAEGLLCFSFCTVNVRSYTLSLYYIIFGLLSICMELHFKFFDTYCRIPSSFPGKRMWYLFLVTLSFGS